MSTPVLTVTVTTEPLPGGGEAFEVHVKSHPKVTAVWGAGMLRDIADGMERDGLDEHTNHNEQEQR